MLPMEYKPLVGDFKYVLPIVIITVITNNSKINASMYEV